MSTHSGGYCGRLHRAIPPSEPDRRGLSRAAAARAMAPDYLPSADRPGWVYIDRQYEKKLLRDLLAEAVRNTARMQKP